MLSTVFVSALLFGTFCGARADCDTVSPTTVGGTHAPVGKICSGDLIFEDNFDEFDLSVWQHELTLSGGYNGEFEYYNNNRSNSFVEDGVLHIKPTFLADETGEGFLSSGTLDINGGTPADQCTSPAVNGCSRTGTPDNIINPIKSARIRSVYSFHFKYGKFEARAKIPSGDWLWPAIWMMPRYNAYSGWPVSGEIDIMESRGNKNLIGSSGVNIGTQQVGNTLHWGPNYNYNRFLYTHFEKNLEEGFDSDFHLYQVEWTPDKIEFSIDDVVVGTVAPGDGGFWEYGELEATGLKNPWIGRSKIAPFDQEFYIILNLAIGATNSYFPDDATNPDAKPWENSSPRAAADFWNARKTWLPTWNVETDDSHLKIDYIKVWAI